ncbi:MAG: acetoin utilization protein AcuC, partial [Actinomycetota bacterium]|nr:acetoin utilization protein AcuC [Actinomycetota bacterium]
MATALIWNDDPLNYDFGPSHPLKPIRVKLTVDLIRACGLTDADNVLTLPRAAYRDDDVRRLHSEAYVDAVRDCSLRSRQSAVSFGLGPGDNPTFAGMHEASLQVCGASV